MQYFLSFEKTEKEKLGSYNMQQFLYVTKKGNNVQQFLKMFRNLNLVVQKYDYAELDDPFES